VTVLSTVTTSTLRVLTAASTSSASQFWQVILDWITMDWRRRETGVPDDGTSNVDREQYLALNIWHVFTMTAPAEINLKLVLNVFILNNKSF